MIKIVLFLAAAAALYGQAATPHSDRSIVRRDANGNVTIGASMSVGSDIKVANGQSLRFRNAIDNADLQAVSVSGGNDLALGSSGIANIYLSTGTAGDIGLLPDGIVYTSGAFRVGGNAGSPPEKLFVLGRGYFVTASGGSGVAFADSQTSSKNWKIGTGYVTPGNFEVLDTSDSASPYLTITPTQKVSIGTTLNYAGLNLPATGVQSGAFSSDTGYGFAVLASGTRALYYSRDSDSGGKTWLFGNGAGSDVANFIIQDASDSATPAVKFTAAGVILPGLHSTTGTRYLCIGTDGTVTSSATACSGT